MTTMSRNDKMQLWIQDRGARGCLVVVALTESAARRLMAAESWNYSPNEPLEAHDLDAGFKFVNVGDQ